MDFFLFSIYKNKLKKNMDMLKNKNLCFKSRSGSGVQQKNGGSALFLKGQTQISSS